MMINEKDCDIEDLQFKDLEEEIDRVHREYPHLNDDAFVRENLHLWLNS